MTEYYDARSDLAAGTKRGGRVIRDGGLVAFPTETVYGLGANGLSAGAVGRIFEAKGRPQDNPLILHVARRSDVKDVWKQVPELAGQLMDAFWPGPLTLVYACSQVVPGEVTAGLDTVAVRMPDNKTALALIRAAGVPVAAPSANLSGRPSPTTAAHVKEDLGGVVDVLIDGGPCRVGVESTVLSLVGKPTILRPGGVTQEMLCAVIGDVGLAGSILSPLAEGETAASPGMKHRHYSPRAKVVVATGSPREAAAKLCREFDMATLSGKHCVILASEQTAPFYHGRTCAIIGSRAEPASMCSGLFASLREFDGADIIFAEALPTGDMGLAYMNRLLRAAGFSTI